MTNCNATNEKTTTNCQSEPIFKGYRVEYADHAQAPNEFTDGLLGKMYWVGHRRYSADTYEYETDVNDYTNANDFMEALEKELPTGSIIDPVYMYSHSGDTISRSPFSCRWDSGWIGVFVVTPKDAKQLRGWKRMSSKRWELAKKDSDYTFAMWKAYVEGDIWEVFEVWEHDHEQELEHIFTCYGAEMVETDLRYDINSRFGELLDPTLVSVTGDYDFTY